MNGTHMGLATLGTHRYPRANLPETLTCLHGCGCLWVQVQVSSEIPEGTPCSSLQVKADHVLLGNCRRPTAKVMAIQGQG
jgi:hypothetical protein